MYPLTVESCVWLLIWCLLFFVSSCLSLLTSVAMDFSRSPSLPSLANSCCNQNKCSIIKASYNFPAFIPPSLFHEDDFLRSLSRRTSILLHFHLLVSSERRGKSTRSRRRKTRRFAVMTEGIHLDQDETQSPGHHFALVFESMQDLFEKMSLLKYSHDFCTEYKCKPIHRYSDLFSRHIFPLIFPNDHRRSFCLLSHFSLMQFLMLLFYSYTHCHHLLRPLVVSDSIP